MPLLTTAQMADILNITCAVLINKYKSGVLPGIDLNGVYRFDKKAVLSHLSKKPSKPKLKKLKLTRREKKRLSSQKAAAPLIVHPKTAKSQEILGDKVPKTAVSGESNETENEFCGPPSELYRAKFVDLFGNMLINFSDQELSADEFKDLEEKFKEGCVKFPRSYFTNIPEVLDKPDQELKYQPYTGEE